MGEVGKKLSLVTVGLLALDVQSPKSIGALLRFLMKDRVLEDDCEVIRDLLSRLQILLAKAIRGAAAKVQTADDAAARLKRHAH